MGFGAIIIGEEIIRGKRQDKHFSKLVEIMGERGLKLDWCMYLGDDPALITATLKRTLATDDVVFSFGGIGAPPDDHTRKCAAAAADVPLELHPEAEGLLRERFGDETTPLRLQMGVFPKGSAIIPNPHNKVPGFSYRHHHFVPGFPVMAWPMCAWVLDTHYPHLFHRVDETEAAIFVYELPESTITPLMTEVEAKHPGLKSFSLPNMGGGPERRHIELGARGAPDAVAQTIERFKQGVIELGGRWSTTLDPK